MLKTTQFIKLLKKKAKQAKKWKNNGTRFQPLVLCIGASENLHQINAINTFDLTQLKKAVYSALLDIEQCDLATRLNFTDNRAWPWLMRKKDDLRVSGSRLISSVIIVTIRNELDVFGLKRKATSLIINNPHSHIELTAEQQQFLNQINFNQVEYGSRQSWENPKPQKISIGLDRYREPRGRFTLKTSPSIAFDVEIPAHLVVRILAGDITAHEVWDDNELDSVEQSIGELLKSAASINQQIIDVNFVQVNPKLREEPKIKLEFGKTVNPKNLIEESYFGESIEFFANDAFMLKLPVNLVIYLLAGKITANEAWRNDNQKKIFDSLKDAMNKGQKIINVKFVQVYSESKNNSHINFEFSAATENIIRG